MNGGTQAHDFEKLHADAGRWADWRYDLAGTLSRTTLSLPASAFSDVPGAQEVYRAFAKAMDDIAVFTREGVTSLQSTHDAVILATLDLMRGEEQNEAAIAAVAAELDG